MDDYFDLGGHSCQITTSHPDAQVWFDRGLVWSYAFNHEEAVKCFSNAIDIDPGCAMAYWGLAYALGPNYNKPWEFFDDTELSTTVARTHTAVDEAAHAVRNGHTAVERDLVEALRKRYPETAADSSETLWTVWNADYADAMREVYRNHTDDLDVVTLFADALMNLTPWVLWDIRTGEPAPGSHALEAKDVLDRALHTSAGRTHPGILHMYIHLMEMSATPEDALVVADRLRGLVPDAGHLEHMPTHLDVLCGDYRRVVSSNRDAISADEKFADREGAMNFYTLYRAHNYHFTIYGAMFLGQSAVAIDTAAELEAAIPESLLRVKSPPMADWLEGFLAMRVHVYIRFGRWQDIIDMALPSDTELYCVTTAMTHYAKSVAYSATSQIEQAEREGKSSETPSAASRPPARCSTTRAWTSSPSQAPCWKANSTIAKPTTSGRSRHCVDRSNWTTACPTTSPGGGCSPRVTPTARCYSNRAASRRPQSCTARISVSTARCRERFSTRPTCGRCMGTTKA